jgi:hypothetical protein
MKMAGTGAAFPSTPWAQKVLEMSLDDKMVMNYEYSSTWKWTVFVWFKIL